MELKRCMFVCVSAIFLVTGAAGGRSSSLPEHDLNVALREANNYYSSIQRLENSLASSDIDVQENSPSHGQLIDSMPSSEASVMGNNALVVNWASAYLLNGFCRRHKIPRDECINSMENWSLNRTSLRRRCNMQFLSTNCRADAKYRSFDGSCNHKEDTTTGQAYSPYIRLLPPAYADGISSARTRSVTRKELPSARLVSSVLVPDLDRPDKVTTLAVAQWAQFVANDLFHTVLHKARHTGRTIECCRANWKALTPRYLHPLCMPISIPTSDPDYSPYRAVCMNYVRSVTSLRSQCNLGPADQMNQASHFLDGSMLYGNSLQRSIELREMSGGRLATTSRNDEQYLPLAAAPQFSCQTSDNSTLCFRTGDSRVNVHPHHTAMYIMWLREHNRIADRLSNLNPHWEDKKIFNEARRIVIAEMQHITYDAWLPVLLGEDWTDRGDMSFDENADPSVSNAAATAGFAFVHSLLQKDIRLYDGARKLNSLVQLEDHFNKPTLTHEPGMLDALVRGLTMQYSQQMDSSVVDDVTSKLYKGDRPYGMDIVSLDIQRGRDHGLPGYMAYRKLCNLPTGTKFDVLSETIPKSVVSKLKSVYAHPEDIDLVIGVLLETPTKGAVVGPTLSCLLSDQMRRTRAGDRYFYSVPGEPSSFSSDQLAEIRKSTLSRILCDNAVGVTAMQRDAFRPPSSGNSLLDCSDSRIERVQLEAWKEGR